jgi:hypothetical protein
MEKVLQCRGVQICKELGSLVVVGPCAPYVNKRREYRLKTKLRFFIYK